MWRYQIKKVFYVNSMIVKLMQACSQISSKHTFKKLSVNAEFQKTRGFFKMDVVQNSKKARQALDTVGAIKFSIPLLLLDSNPIENIFKYVKKELSTQAFEKNMNYEIF